VGLLDDLAKIFAQEEKEYGTPSRTMRGETVRSKSEKKIADYFATAGIRYVYEWKAQTNAVIFKRTFAHPDFYLPDYDVYVEYWGLLGASREYERVMKWKMSQYYQNKIRFISLYPKNLENLDWVFRAKFRKAVGRDLPPRQSYRPGEARFCTHCGTPLTSRASFCTSCGRPVPLTR
jgi:zinc-ribbon domain